MNRPAKQGDSKPKELGVPGGTSPLGKATVRNIVIDIRFEIHFDYTPLFPHESFGFLKNLYHVEGFSITQGEYGAPKPCVLSSHRHESMIG